MSKDLGFNEKPEKGICYHHIPGSVSQYEFSINKDKKTYVANLIFQYGQNPKKVTPIVGWIKTDDGKIYSPEYFLSEIIKLEKIFKYDDQTFRHFTLYSGNGKVKVKINRSVSSDKFDIMPLACISEEGGIEEPKTYINKESIYFQFISNISSGNLNDVIILIKERKEEIIKAYPYMNILISNIEKVHDNLHSLAWFNDNLEKNIGKKDNIQSFDQLSNLFEKIFKESEGEKGILRIISKAFAYVPRD